MPYRPHHLFVFGGTLGGAGVEVWQCGIRGTYTPFSGSEADFLGDMIAPMKAWFADAGSRIRNDATLTYLKLNAIAANGDYAQPNNPHGVNFAPTAGGTPPMTPEFTTIATSWRTDSPNRFALNGRIYPPNTVSGSPGSTRIPTADQTAIAQAGVNLIVLLRNGSDETGGGVFRATVESNHAAEFSAITRVRVGDVIDVQRRRKNAIRESYRVDNVPAP